MLGPMTSFPRTQAGTARGEPTVPQRGPALESRLTATYETEPLVTFIRSQPGMARHLLAEHAEDGRGCCRVCSQGAQAGRYVWPCAISLAAAVAKTSGPASCGESVRPVSEIT
jgi:hypothetical protein